ncbi:hypothetical protein Dimus_027485 [Dionaea muscipula]
MENWDVYMMSRVELLDRWSSTCEVQGRGSKGWGWRKPGISALALWWSSSERDEKKCLDGLRPHPNLKWLLVRGFNGDSFPSWFTRMTVVNNDSDNRRHLTSWWSRCSRLPTLGQLPVLKTLVIDGMEAVRQIGKEFYTQSEGNRNGVRPDSSSDTQERVALFPVLTTLEINNCPNLAEWLQPESINPPDVESFPCLEKLKIVGCPFSGNPPPG